MTCNNCNHMMIQEEIPKESDDGEFIEHWKCPRCGASEYVAGKEEQPPQEWEHWGSAV